MGARYILEVTCPKCNHCDKNVYFAPTCEITDWECPKCKHKVDLYEYTGINYEATPGVVADLCQDFDADIVEGAKQKKRGNKNV